MSWRLRMNQASSVIDLNILSFPYWFLNSNWRLWNHAIARLWPQRSGEVILFKPYDHLLAVRETCLLHSGFSLLLIHCFSSFWGSTGLQNGLHSACGVKKKKKSLDLSRILCKWVKDVGIFKKRAVGFWPLWVIALQTLPVWCLPINGFCSVGRNMARPVLCTPGVSAVWDSLLAVSCVKVRLGNANSL